MVLVVALVCSPDLCAQEGPRPRSFPRQRPLWEFTSWVSLGGGARVAHGDATGLFDLRLGGDATLPIGRKGNLRLGPYLEAATATFASLATTGGVELFVGAAPRPLRMFYYSGEGVFLARVGAGWSWNRHDPLDARSAPVATLTVSYGYRAPFSLREVEDQTDPTPDAGPAARYMIGARLWGGAMLDLGDPDRWQLSGGIEFEPVGSFRYLLGLY